MLSHLSKPVAEEELLTMPATILFEEVMEASPTREATWMAMMEAAAWATLSCHRVVRVVAVVISCSELWRIE